MLMRPRAAADPSQWPVRVSLKRQGRGDGLVARVRRGVERSFAWMAVTRGCRYSAVRIGEEQHR
jgi:hypothetical protein